MEAELEAAHELIAEVEGSLAEAEAAGLAGAQVRPHALHTTCVDNSTKSNIL